ncbi:hypothetical protein K0M31_017300 [Melipona bicolor]|uniref:UBC core domain-containing protein n=1 Tax=Melipona bicolor TaxID=60889 RepID=A0AA40G4U5_9HYME|nr:hypothetical protein K0M31_017300 [Melipona bicolor]
MAQTTSSALRALALEYKSLQEEPVEGFRVKLVNEDNMFEWEVAIFGPPDTLYQGGYFKAHMKFPPDYPYSPPSIRFMTKVWHPNVYETCSETKMLKSLAKSRNDSITVLTDTQRNLGKSVRLPSHPTSRGLDTSFPLHTRGILKESRQTLTKPKK